MHCTEIRTAPSVDPCHLDPNLPRAIASPSTFVFFEKIFQQSKFNFTSRRNDLSTVRYQGVASVHCMKASSHVTIEFLITALADFRLGVIRAHYKAMRGALLPSRRGSVLNNQTRQVLQSLTLYRYCTKMRLH
jgi:hypothetical protein